MIRVCVCRDAQKEAGLAEKKLQRLEASRDAEQAGLREQLDTALAGVQPRACAVLGMHGCSSTVLASRA